jgi:outer membrane receptor protein involved in Fe transport
MTGSRGVIAGLFISTALASVFTAESAFAQSAAANAAASAQNQNTPANAQLLGDVVVTATRQADTVNRVPLSISAVTQQSLDQQGIKNVNDLQRAVPELQVTGTEAGVATFNIRGIIQSGAVAATTGVYLDDVPLQKRNTQGVSQNNGTPAPPLFDLERVEVLRGPQGTLYGGSSEGGTIRFIEPQPSLVRYSGLARAEVSSTEYGNPSYEAGVAFGGPIVQDKLGFRATVYDRHTGGYIDLYDPYTGRDMFPNANSSDSNSYRLALLWAPSENSRVSLTYYNAWTRESDTTSAYMLPLNGTITAPSYCYKQPAPGSLFPSTSPPASPCPATAVPGQTVNGVYMRPSQTYGPFNFGPFTNLVASVQGKSPAVTAFSAPSLTLEYDFEKMTVKSITSYIEDETRAQSWENPQVSNVTGVTDRNGAFYAPGSTVAFKGTSADVTTGTSLFRPYPEWAGRFHSKSQRWGLIQELRFSSAGDAKPFSWVGGLYFSDIRAHTHYELPENTDLTNRLLFGIPNSNQRYSQQVNLSPGQTCSSLGLPAGTPSLNTTKAGVGAICLVGLPELPGAITSERDQRLTDIEIAGYGEANYWVTDKLKLTGGIRWSRVEFNYTQVFFGPFSGFNEPTVENTGITNGDTVQSPITPKVGLQYQLTDDDMVYVNAAKGYREGGVNVPLPVAICGPGLALIGLSVADAPKAFDSDTVWSYEAGTKLRLLENRLQLNASAYRIDWSNVQLNVRIPNCGPTFIQNAGTARSQGFDVEASARIWGGLSGNLAVGYDNAEYTQTATGPVPKNGTPATPVVQKGDKLSVPPWTVTASLQYDFDLAKYRAYVRGDYQFASDYLNGVGPGVSSYSPDSYNMPSTTVVNARAGITIGHVDANVYVNNVFKSVDPLGVGGGRGGCTPNTDPSCATFSTFNPISTITTFRPRTVGVQVNYRY